MELLHSQTWDPCRQKELTLHQHPSMESWVLELFLDQNLIFLISNMENNTISQGYFRIR